MRKRVGVVGGVLFVAAGSLGAQNTWFVDDDNCPGPGTGTQGSPFCDVQSAIDAGTSGDTILVQPGTYPSVDFKGKDVDLRSLQGPSVTDLNGAVFNTGETRNAILDGFTISSDGNLAENGVRCEGASPTIRNNVIEGNIVINGGAGIYLDSGADALIVQNVIQNNMAWPATPWGAGILSSSSSPVIVSNTIQGNFQFGDSSGGLGAGICLFGGAPIVANNLIVNNTSGDEFSNHGGGLYAGGCAPLISGNTFSGNTAADGTNMFGEVGRGGAIHLFNSAATIVDSILWNDTATEGPELYINGGTTNITFSDFQGGPLSIDGAGTVNIGSGFVNTDPLFGGGFHLSAASPLIDGGDPGRIPGGLDMDLDPRILDGDSDKVGRVDIGADEVNQTTITVSGTSALGDTITFTTQAPAGQTYFLTASTQPADSPFKWYGSTLVKSPILVLSTGTVPGADAFFIPASPALVGRRAYFQAFAFNKAAKVGNLSRRVEVVIF